METQYEYKQNRLYSRQGNRFSSTRDTSRVDNRLKIALVKGNR